jgi:hypothetical protein
MTRRLTRTGAACDCRRSWSQSSPSRDNGWAITDISQSAITDIFSQSAIGDIISQSAITDIISQSAITDIISQSAISDNQSALTDDRGMAVPGQVAAD